MKPILAALTCLLVASDFAAAELKPLMTVPADIALADDFEKPHPLKKDEWQQRQGTRWAIEDGVLRGRESSAEYQAARPHHKGLEPRISVPTTPKDFVARFSVRFLEGQPNAIVPFVEFGHHICRVRFSRQGVELLAEGESIILARSDKLEYEPGHWYHCLAEMKDSQFVIQFEDGTTLHAAHESFRRPPTGGGAGLGIAGPRNGLVEVDNLEIRRTHRLPQESWPETMKTLPTIDPIVVPAKRKKFEAKQKANKQAKN